MPIYTIGFSKKNLRQFITRLKEAGVTKVIDIRLNNTSQLAGYAKKEDLQYVLELVGIEYEHRPDLAPSEELMKGFKEKKITWEQYEIQFNRLLEEKRPYEILARNENEVVCLMCAEDKPDHCHRRLVAEYIARDLGTEIKHL